MEVVRKGIFKTRCVLKKQREKVLILPLLLKVLRDVICEMYINLSSHLLVRIIPKN